MLFIKLNSNVFLVYEVFLNMFENKRCFAEAQFIVNPGFLKECSSSLEHAAAEIPCPVCTYFMSMKFPFRADSLFVNVVFSLRTSVLEIVMESLAVRDIRLFHT